MTGFQGEGLFGSHSSGCTNTPHGKGNRCSRYAGHRKRFLLADPQPNACEARGSLIDSDTMGALLISILAVVVSAVVPFIVEVYKNTRSNQEQNYITGISACAELVATSPGTPTGYCHLKYVIINNSGNAIHEVIVVQPRWRPQQPINVINATTQHEEQDLTLRLEDPGFTSYAVGIIFKEGQGRLWHKHHVAERVRKVMDPPRSVHDFVPYKNPLGMATVGKRVGLGLAAFVMLIFPIYGIVAFVENWTDTGATPGAINPSVSTKPSAGSDGR
ncbi:hypothetical protein [Streptomyces sp. NPDC055085]